jgi:hypothetical protein
LQHAIAGFVRGAAETFRNFTDIAPLLCEPRLEMPNLGPLLILFSFLKFTPYK